MDYIIILTSLRAELALFGLQILCIFHYSLSTFKILKLWKITLPSVSFSFLWLVFSSMEFSIICFINWQLCPVFHYKRKPKKCNCSRASLITAQISKPFSSKLNSISITPLRLIASVKYFNLSWTIHEYLYFKA